MNSRRKKRLLITGVSGLLGNNLAFCLKDKYDILGIYHAHRVEIDGVCTEEGDLASEDFVRDLMRRFDPEVIIHCAAISDVDFCEENQELAYRVNVQGTRILVDHVPVKTTKFIYISTDLVYEDVPANPLTEQTRTDPPNYYAVTKLKGEQEASQWENTLVLRTNIFGWNIQEKFSLGEWVVHELSHQRRIQGFNDACFSSIYTFELAKIIDRAIDKNLRGMYNCGSSTFMSKNEFAHKVASRFGLSGSLIEPISVDQADLKAKRRKNLGLDVRAMENALGCRFPTLDESIKKFFEDYQKGIPRQIKKKVFRRIYPVLDHIPYGRQSITEEDIQAVVEVLKSSYLTQGPKIVEFEQALLSVTGAAFCVAVNSGTSALHIACLAAGVGPGDEVVTSPNTFVASANCVVYCGGKPVFADIDPATYNVSPQEIEKKITEKTKAVIPVHFAGQSCDMETIERVVRAKEKKYGHKIYIIEDACHALGSTYRDTKVGSCVHSDMVVMSFHPVKHITTGEGGAVFVNDRKLWRKLSYLRSHGITSDVEEFVYKEDIFEDTTASAGSGAKPLRRQWYYEQNSLGFNYRITDIQCALGRSQLKKLDEFCRRRREIVNRYNKAFRKVGGLTTPFEADFCKSNFHLYVLLFDFEEIGITRSELIAGLKENGIFTQVHYIPVYTQPFYRNNFGTNWGDCPRTEEYYQKCLSIPVYPAMTAEDIENVIAIVKQLVKPRSAVS